MTKTPESLDGKLVHTEDTPPTERSTQKWGAKIFLMKNINSLSEKGTYVPKC